MRLKTCIALMVCLISTAHAADPKKIEPLEAWQGKNGDKKLEAQAPKSGFVADADAWKKLWAAWRGNEELPKVDFAKELILVATAGGPNRVNLTAKLDDKGDVKILGMATRMAGPGFGYAIAKVGRDGIKTVDGQAIGGK